jgi:hypothetical protein
MKIEDSEGYKKLLASVERDEKDSPNSHDYRTKLSWILDRASHYAEKTGLVDSDILDAWEKRRDYWYMNYYQESCQPEIKGDEVKLFNTVDEFLESVGNDGFRCPCCGGISKSPYKCNTGLIVSGIKDGKDGPCNWTVNGLFRDLGKCVKVFVKSELKGDTIFMPIAWEALEAVKE